VEKPCIRVTVLGFAKRGDGILVFEGYDAIKDEVFYRFPGGGVEFRRKSRVALQREFKEEINANILDMKYLCTIENIFTFEGIDKHEILLVYQVILSEELYKKDELILNENGTIGKAMWIDKKEFMNGVRNEIIKYL